MGKHCFLRGGRSYSLKGTFTSSQIFLSSKGFYISLHIMYNDKQRFHNIVICAHMQCPRSLVRTSPSCLQLRSVTYVQKSVSFTLVLSVNVHVKVSARALLHGLQCLFIIYTYSTTQFIQLSSQSSYLSSASGVEPETYLLGSLVTGP